MNVAESFYSICKVTITTSPGSANLGIGTQIYHTIGAAGGGEKEPPGILRVQVIVDHIYRQEGAYLIMCLIRKRKINDESKIDPNLYQFMGQLMLCESN